jgi:hypothetical protein
MDGFTHRDQGHSRLGMALVTAVSALFYYFFLVEPALAQAPAGTYVPLAPLPGIGGPFDFKTTGALPKFLTGVFTLAIGIAGVLAVVMLVVCGIKMMGTPSASARSEAKECIWNAIFGLLLAIGSWVLLYTINPALVANDVTSAKDSVSSAPAPTAGAPIDEPLTGIPGWYYKYQDKAGNKIWTGNLGNKENCETSLQKAVAAASASGQTPLAVPPDATPQCREVRQSPIGGSEKANRDYLASNNVFVNRNPCPNPAQYSPGCTNIAGLPSATLDMIIALKSSCCSAQPPQCTNGTAVLGGGPCLMVITGGTEMGHAAAGSGSHAPGNSVVDLRKNPTLDKYIRANATKEAASFCTGRGCHNRYLLNGFWFTDEGDHWHACADGASPFYCRNTNKAGGALVCKPPASGTGPQQCT